ncbi:MAG: hypothetical protein M1834_004904 [Cirrosporium novae-zelandiae]|nr:MAG: hypothetical protein M1834_004904 [Cirrosporium novae-zelandiae]
MQNTRFETGTTGPIRQRSNAANSSPETRNSINSPPMPSITISPPPRGRSKQQSDVDPDVTPPKSSSINPSSINPSQRNHGDADLSLRGHRAAAFRQLEGHSPTSDNTRYHSPKSVADRTSVSSQPVIVRSYTPSLKSPPMSNRRASSDYGSEERSKIVVNMPSPEAFSIKGILDAIEPDIRATIDAIAEICGRSRMSLANEYGSHLPPQGEIIGAHRYGNFTSLRSPMDHTLMPVEEATSSTERLAGEADNGVLEHEVHDVPKFRARAGPDAYRRLERIMSSSSKGDDSKLHNGRVVKHMNGASPSTSHQEKVSDRTSLLSIPSARSRDTQIRLPCSVEASKPSTVQMEEVTGRMIAAEYLESHPPQAQPDTPPTAESLTALSRLRDILRRQENILVEEDSHHGPTNSQAPSHTPSLSQLQPTPRSSNSLASAISQLIGHVFHQQNPS